MTRPAFDPTAPARARPGALGVDDAALDARRPAVHMTDMIAAEPYLAARILDRLADPQGAAGRLAGAIGQAASSGRADRRHRLRHERARGAGDGRDPARGDPGGRDAERGRARSSRRRPSSWRSTRRRGGLVIGVSHEGGTAATNRALAAASAAGARTALITASAGSPGGQLRRDRRRDGRARPELVPHGRLPRRRSSPRRAVGGASRRPHARRATTSRRSSPPGRATRPAPRRSPAASPTPRELLVIASGADRPAARELVLKVEEASWLPSAMRDLETFLHGHLPAIDASTGARPHPHRPGRARAIASSGRARRSRRPRSSGLRTAAIVAARRRRGAPRRADAGRPADRRRGGRLPAPVAALLGTATPLQLLTERIARARGTNPDPIRRDDPRYADGRGRRRVGLTARVERRAPRPSGRSSRDRAAGSPGA